jgi:hypothetical protein
MKIDLKNGYWFIWCFKFVSRFMLGFTICSYTIIAVLGIIKAPWLIVEVHPGTLILTYVYGFIQSFILYYIGWVYPLPLKKS